MTKRPPPVAVVAGATRGAGRGIATALGEAGFIVYCTGRSSKLRTLEGFRTSRDELRPAEPAYARRASAVPRARDRDAGAFDLASRPETIEETAELVTARGGRGIAVRVDHTVEAEVRALFDRVRADEGRLDVLVNDVWGGDSLIEAASPFGRPFWEIDAEAARTLFERCVFSHLLTARLGVPLMVAARRGLVVEVTDGELLNHRGSFLYDLVKTTVIRLAFAMAEELRPHKVAAVAVTPGFLRSEAMLEHFGVTEANWREGGHKDANFLVSETPLYVGRGVAALAADRRILSKSGRTFSSWRLARTYRFTDADGSRPDWGKHVTGGADRGTRAIFRGQFASHDRFIRSFASARSRP